MKTQDDIRKDLGYLDCGDCEHFQNQCKGEDEICNHFEESEE